MNQDPLVWLSYVSFPLTTAVYFERAFRKKYKVQTVGPRMPEDYIKDEIMKNMNLNLKDLDIPTEYGVLDFRQILESMPPKSHPDFFLWIESVVGYLPVNIKGNGFPTSCYLIDTHINLNAHLEIAKNFDYTFIAQREYIPEFKKEGIDNVFWIPLAADPDIHSKKVTEKLYDVGFAGSINSEYHRRRVNLINKMGNEIKVSYKRCWLDEMAEFFSASKIVFNNSISNDLNMRVFEAMSTGSFLLSDIAKGSGQEEMFKDGEDLGTYNDDDIVDKAKFYLAHDYQREKIAERGRQLVHQAHTYTHRIDEILKVSSGEKKETPTAEEWRSRSLDKTTHKVNMDLRQRNKHAENKRSFVIPVLDMSPASPYNIVKLLDDLGDISGDVIVIFNSQEMAEKLKDHPRINYYAAMNKNVGVSRAWNIGLNMSQTPITFILNSDLHMGKETVLLMEKYLLNLPDAAIVGPQGSFFNFETAKDMHYLNKGTFKYPVVVDAVSGFLFAVKTELFNSGVIKFDNQYTPCYFEEWDLGLQIKQVNMKSYAVPVNSFEHEWSGSIRAMRKISYLNKEETTGEILERNRTLFWSKWKGINILEGENSSFLKSNLKDLLLNQAEELVKQSQFTAAENVIKELSLQYPQDMEVLEKLGLLYYKSDRLEEALEVFERIREVDPDYQIQTGEPGSKNQNSGPNGGYMKRKEDGYYKNDRQDIQSVVNPDSRVILDVGCGAGVLGSALKEKANAEVWGIEFNEKAAIEAQLKLDNVIPGKAEDAIADLPDNYFDTIIFADVLEHLVDPYSVIEDIKKKLAPGGEIVVSIPNVRHWSVVKQLLEGNWKYEKWGIMDSTHLRFFTKQSITEMFEGAGFKIKEIYCVAIETPGLVPSIISSLREANLNVDTLEDESKHFQYILKVNL